ncbi:MAG: hypothetical protein ACRDIW_02545, partial [Actinomycetota bacterium]
QAAAIDLSTTASGAGYWILDEVGGMFTFGDAKFFGSVPGLRNDCIGSRGTAGVLRVTVLKAKGGGVDALLAYYAGLAQDQQSRDGAGRGPVDYYLEPRRAARPLVGQRAPGGQPSDLRE